MKANTVYLVKVLRIGGRERVLSKKHNPQANTSAELVIRMKTCLSLVCILCALVLRAQTYEVGLFAGGTNNIGDVGRTTYILPSNMALGGLFKWNKSSRYAWRAGLTYGQFTADDSKSDSPSRQQRGLVAKNSLLEVSAGLEFNFVDYNLHELGPAFTPYLYTGFTYFRYDYNHFLAGEYQDTGRRDGALAIPMVFGAKLRLNQYLILGAEIGARYAITDNLDGSNPTKSNLVIQDNTIIFGNANSNDWYVFTGFTLTYTFGRKPCMDCFE